MICGVKLSHDGAVALIDHNRLVACVEVEKLGNRARHTDLNDLSLWPILFDAMGVSDALVDDLVIDGWARFPDGAPRIDVRGPAGTGLVEVAGYSEYQDDRFVADPMTPIRGVVQLGTRGYAYTSYPHAIGHVWAGYCTSPFAGDSPAYVLVWDGGMPATLYYVDPGREPSLQPLGPILDLNGAIYPMFAACYPEFAKSLGEVDPFSDAGHENALVRAFLPISGRAMAYAGLGTVEPEVKQLLVRLLAQKSAPDPESALAWCAEATTIIAPREVSSATAIASFESFLGDALIDALERARRMFGIDAPLCFAGGSALNIKWNSRIRSSQLFSDYWVPPFPNDSGSAIGAACTQMVASKREYRLVWDVFGGAEAGSTPTTRWSQHPMSPEELGSFMARRREPVVVVSGRAELGPRALGHRSILAPATDPSMRDRLNAIKGREPYRPVAPVCLEQFGPQIFEPGTRDPYMLFDHEVRPEWRGRIPAVVHVDGTARLQTVAPDNELLYKILTGYHEIAGIPVLCNTSANRRGCGFFPDAASAIEWGGVDYVWSAGTLYARPDGQASDGGLQ